MTAERAFGYYLARKDYRHPMIEWAMDRLTAGSDCESTVLLAGADFEADDEVLRLFRRSAAEEGIRLPDPEGELVWLERWLCAEIVAGRLETRAGLAALYRLWVDSEFDPKFDTWLYLAESVELLREGYGGLDPFHEMRLGDVNATILREAKSVIEGQGEV